MKRRSAALAACLLFVLFVPAIVLADAAGDLKTGQEALAAGDLEKARPLLESAAQGLPQSVEAHVALAECYTKLGQLDKALAEYRAVLKISPNHALAKQVVAAMTGQQTSIDERLAAARALMDVGAYAQVEALLAGALTEPIGAEKRTAVRLVVAEARLWAGSAAGALTEALRVVHESQKPAETGPARVIAAWSLLAQGETGAEKAAELLKAAGELAEPWAARAKLAALVIQHRDEKADSAETSKQLAALAASLPDGGVRTNVVGEFASSLFSRAREAAGRGDLAAALAIVWPAVSDQPVPGADAVLKPVSASGGWLSAKRFVNQRLEAARILADVGQAEFAQDGVKAVLRGYWLAAEVLRQTPGEKAQAARLALATELGSFCRTPPDRKSGTPLSQADELQRAIALAAALDATREQARQQAVALLAAQLTRYEAVDDLRYGLSQLLTVQAGEGGAPKFEWAGGIDKLPVGPARTALWMSVAEAFSRLAAKEFAQQAASPVTKANLKLLRDDEIALTLAGQVAVQAPDEPRAAVVLQQVLDRYAAADRWSEVLSGIKAYYGSRSASAGRWALVRYKIQQAIAAEEKLRKAQRQLPAELSALVKEALAEGLQIHKDISADANRVTLRQTAESLLARYASLDRYDLAEAVIAAVVEKADEPPLGDWAVWARANLLERKAATALAVAASQFDARSKLPLDPSHKAELDLLAHLTIKLPTSEYAPLALERVLQISGVYQGYGSFDTASAVLKDFLAAHAAAKAPLAAAERIEYQIVVVAIAKATDAFANRKEPQKPPEAISAEHQAAIDLLAAFLKAHPAGDLAGAAAQQLLAIARTYAEAGAWPVARAVVDRFAAAVPDYHSPNQLKFLRAATYLGELDAQHGLSLLAQPTADNKGSNGGEVMLAMTPPPDTSAAFAFPGGGSGAGGFGGAGRGDRLGGGPGESKPTSGASTASGTASKPDDGLYDFGARIPAGPGLPANEPTAEAVAMIRQSQQRQFQQIAMLESRREAEDKQAGQGSQAVALPTGQVLSDAEMKRQDAAADAAYKILIDLVKTAPPSEHALAAHARAQILWMIGFFEGQQRADRSIALINQYLTDRPNDPAKVALAFQAIQDRLAWAAQRQPGERIDQEWVDQRHVQFEQARKEISAFIASYADKPDWINQAHLLTVTSYLQEAELAAAHSAVRAGGLLVRSVEALLALLRIAPQHPEVATFPQRIWSVADRLQQLGQNEQAIFVLNQIPLRFPNDALSAQAVLRIANLHAAGLANPIRAAETYLEYLAIAGDDESIRAAIFNMAQQLGGTQRYLEALHVYGVFVDSFPTDGRAPAALAAIGQIHQTNEVWKDAIATYQRILSEYPGDPGVPHVKLAIAECHINLSEWRQARKQYEEFLVQHGGDGQAEMARVRVEILKNLDRYETLLADGNVVRNKDDAQFQIGRIVLEQLRYPVKAVAEFRKVVANFGKSDLADDAQIEIGKALLALNRVEEARAELLKVPQLYPNSPLSDDALFLIGQSYEQHAQLLAGLTVEKAKEEAFERGQRGAYARFAKDIDAETARQTERRDQLKKAGKEAELALDEASSAARGRAFNDVNLWNFAQAAGQAAETESALQLANRQDKINEAYREAVGHYVRAASDYPLGDKTDQALLRVAQIYQTQLKDRPAAMATYQKIVKQFPGTPVAEDAAWQVAQFYEQEGKFVDAAGAYREFIRNYPASGRVADAQFALAEVLEQLGRWVDAMDAYETFRQKFAAHPKAQLALEQINWIKAYRK